MKKIVLIISSLFLMLSFAGCKKSEDRPDASEKSGVKQGPIIDAPSPAPGLGVPGERPQLTVVVPPEVEEQWSAVTIIVEDKEANKESEYTVGIGEEIKLPDAKLVIKIGPFLPDFKMSGSIITSSSAEPENPSVGIKVFEDGQLVFPSTGEWGWLYAKFPNIHSFQHEKYALALKAGTRK